MRLQLLAISALCVSTLAAHADDLFTLTGNGNTFSFSLPSSPTPGGTDTGQGFFVDNVSVDINGSTSNQNLLFYIQTDDGGLTIDQAGAGFSKADILLNQFGAQLFTGTVDDPTFTLGTFDLQDYGNGAYKGDYTVNISAESPTVTPEPSSFILLGSGILGVAGAIRRKLA